MARTVVAGKAAGTNNSTIIVTAPTGSLVYIINQDSKWKYVEEKNGVWTFKNCDIGTWTIHASLNGDTASSVLEITEEDQRMRYYVNIGYHMYASDFDWSQFGTLGVDYEIVYDDDTPIPQNLWATEKNWKSRLLTSNTLIVLKSGEIDVFMVGGGGDGGNNQSTNHSGAGGGGGYTKTQLDVHILPDVSYPITIGGPGGESSAFGISAPGGSPGESGTGASGGDGGSGGGSNARIGSGGDGGTDGGNGSRAENTSEAGYGGDGQGTTTREFGEPDGRLYAGGGGGGGGGTGGHQSGAGGLGGGAGGPGGSNGSNGEANTGGGGGGAGGKTTSGTGSVTGGKGGSGIVVIRNAREVA